MANRQQLNRMLRLHVNSTHPQPRHVGRAVEILRRGGLAVYPTDTTYGLGCDIFNKRAIERIYQLKGLAKSHPLSFLCADLSEVSRYAVIRNEVYRILRHHTPGKYTFILPASREVPKLLQSNAKTVGVRLPESPVCAALVRELGHPLISTTAARHVDDGVAYTNDPDEVAELFRRSVEVFLDAGPLYGAPSTIIDLTGDEPVVVREGSGDVSWFESA